MISIAVPTYSMPSGDYFFKRLLDSLWSQTYQDFEIVVTDNSDDGVVEAICEYYKTGIRYFHNPIKGMAQNTNEAIRRSEGNLIKILYQDDYLSHKDSLKKIVTHFEGEWLVSGCLHDDGLEVFRPHVPHWSYDDICAGKNVVGSPSVLTIRNNKPLFFDENMSWLLDVDYYRRMYEKYGEPSILKDKNVIIGLHPDQTTHVLGNERKMWEHEYMIKKYE